MGLIVRLLSEESGVVLGKARLMRVDLSKSVSFVLGTHTSNDVLEETKVFVDRKLVASSVIDKQFERGLFVFANGTSTQMSDFSRKAWVLVDVKLSEDGVGVVFLHLLDAGDNALALFTALVLQLNDRHLSFRHLHDFSKGCTIW